MSDAVAAPAAPAKATKKRAGGSTKAKKPSDHPTYSDMIKNALTALKVCINFCLLVLNKKLKERFGHIKVICKVL